MGIFTKNKIPDISAEQTLVASKVLILAMLGASAEKLKISQDKFKDRQGNLLGDFEIIVKRKKG